MNNFIIRDGEYERVHGILVKRVPEFTDSPEYSMMSETELSLPGVVVSAFSRFLVRHERAVPNDSETELISRCYKAIEELAKSHDPDVVNLIQVDFIENIDEASPLFNAIISKLHTASKEIYEDWRRRQN